MKKLYQDMKQSIFKFPRLFIALSIIFIFFVTQVSAQVIPDPETILRKAGKSPHYPGRTKNNKPLTYSGSSQSKGGKSVSANRPSFKKRGLSTPKGDQIDESNLFEKEQELIKKYEFSKIDPDGDKVKLSFREVPLQEVLEFITLQTGINLFLDTDLRADKPVTLFIEDLTMKEILENLIATNGLNKKMVKTNTYLLYPARKSREYKDLKPEVFFLEYENARDLLKILKTKDNFVYLGDRTNSVIVYDTPEKLIEISGLVKELDKERPQIEIQLELLEIERKKLREYGITLNDLQGDPGVGLESFTDQLAHHTLVAGSPTLKMLKELATTKVLASPKIRLVDYSNSGKPNQATIQIGGKEPIRIYTTSGNGATGSTTTEAQYTTSIQWQDTGVKMGVTALKVHNNDKVTVEIELEVTSIASYTTEGYPRVRTKAAKTALRLDDKETIVMGGLINNETSKVVNKTPLLGDLPVIGKLFRKSDTKKTDTEIVMFVTPAIIRSRWNSKDDEAAYKRFGEAVKDVVSEKFKVLKIPAEKKWNKEGNDDNKDKSSSDKSSLDKSSLDKSSLDKSSLDKSSLDKSSLEESSRVSEIFSKLKSKYGIK